MRTLPQVLFALTLALLCSRSAWTQERSASGARSDYDASICDDPRIAIDAAQENATPFHEAPPTAEATPLRAALTYLAEKYRNYDIDRAGACLHAPGVVYLVPNNHVDELYSVLDEIAARQPGGDEFNGNGGGDEGPPNQQITRQQPPGPGPVGGGGPQPPWPPQSANDGGYYDPCHDYRGLDMNTAAGRAAAYQRCSDFLCQHNPYLTRCKTEVALSKPPKTLQPAKTPCNLNRPLPSESYWSPAQQQVLKRTLDAAKKMLLAAKARVMAWDKPTRAASKEWMGANTPAMRKILLSRIDGSLAILKNVNVDNNMSPSLKPELDKEATAYVLPAGNKSDQEDPLIFVTPLFWQTPDKGAYSKPTVIIHELSHLYGGGYTKDVDYGEEGCRVLAENASNPATPFLSAVGEKFGMPKYDPLNNADSFRLFIYNASLTPAEATHEKLMQGLHDLP